MFEVFDKEIGDKYKVYNIFEDSNGYPKFLIRKDNQWLHRSAKHYIPVDEPINKELMMKWSGIKTIAPTEIISYKSIQYCFYKNEFLPITERN